MTTAFDPTDKKYQVSPEFPPDKESSWPFPAENDGWMGAHNALRKEMTDIVNALNAVKSRGDMKSFEVTAMQALWKSHHDHVEAHHRNEDELFVPFLKERFAYPEKAVADHSELVKMFGEISGLVDSLKEGDKVDSLCEKMIQYEEEMDAHLKMEEDMCLPLMRAYFTQAEITPMVQKIVGAGVPQEMGSFIHCMGEEKFRNEFMVQEGIPGFVWYIDLRSRVKTFEKCFLVHLDTLLSG
eukprot:CAMPEP_0116060754 /NCGR_PEP_ID=MMETSP0322-20121206/6616_1 /TAXON_ID=163516 /ORGANISM="Leptocylindrus danicus var. apora, Strain B651" /LENGTH=239 /DNA_ID=CAMNT_0003545459 /DNA_START=107 /DNA_END=823 /DNA_ORIENTATION=+